MLLLPKSLHHTYIAQTALSPQSVLAKTADLQGAVNWGIGVSAFIFSMIMLATFIRYIYGIGDRNI